MPTFINFPPRPNKFLNSLWNKPLSLTICPSTIPSSSIRLVQSVLPVLISTCSAYGAIDPLSGVLWSISKSDGIGRHVHVGAGHVSTTGKGVKIGTRSLEACRNCRLDAFPRRSRSSVGRAGDARTRVVQNVDMEKKRAVVAPKSKNPAPVYFISEVPAAISLADARIPYIVLKSRRVPCSFMTLFLRISISVQLCKSSTNPECSQRYRMRSKRLMANQGIVYKNAVNETNSGRIGCDKSRCGHWTTKKNPTFLASRAEKLRVAGHALPKIL